MSSDRAIVDATKMAQRLLRRDAPLVSITQANGAQF
jgi:hypothetical protein